MSNTLLTKHGKRNKFGPDPSELATILAALRAFQERYEDCSAENIIADWPHFEDVPPLGSEDINDLCERLNR